jgi:hypothetical protein
VKNNTTGRQGSWSDIERSQFEQGVIEHGWGKWSVMEHTGTIPTRNRIQIMSYAWKFQHNHPADYQRLLREHEAYLASTPSVAV